MSFGFSSCNSDTDGTLEMYKDWREFNRTWLLDQFQLKNPDGTSFYESCAMPTDPQAYVLKHTIGEEHTDALKPLYTSSTKVNYTLTLANDSVVDQGTDFVRQLNSTGLISGWGLAIMQMHVGDSAQFVIPYALGYGTAGAGTIPPYSNLQFNIRLLDIPTYEIRP